MLRPAIRHVSAAVIGIVAGLALIAGFAAWRLSQGHIAAGAFRPVAERWLAAETCRMAGLSKLGSPFPGHSRSAPPGFALRPAAPHSRGANPTGD